MVMAYFKYYPRIFLEGLRKTKVKHSWYSRCSGLDSNWVHLDYKLRELHRQLRRSCSAISRVNQVLLQVSTQKYSRVLAA
jgi:hypothetical protein